jgi:hypothetical protein
LSGTAGVSPDSDDPCACLADGIEEPDLLCRAVINLSVVKEGDQEISGTKLLSATVKKLMLRFVAKSLEIILRDQLEGQMILTGRFNSVVSA